MIVLSAETFPSRGGTLRRTVSVAKANDRTNNTDKSIRDASCPVSDVTFQARAAESTNLSYLGIREAGKEREMQ